MIDTHAHLDFSQFDQDREEVIRRAFLNGVKKIINVGCNIERAREAIKMAEKYDNIYAAVGIHPSDVTSQIKNQKSKIKNLEELKIMAQHPKVVAIGEIGLDYFHMDGDDYNVETRQCLVSTLEKIKIKQKEMFIAQLKLARSSLPCSAIARLRDGEKLRGAQRKLDLPVIIHCRPSDESGDAYNDLLDILQSFYESDMSTPSRHLGVCRLHGVAHCFSGTREHAQKFLDLGFHISFTGNITYPKKPDAEILQVVREVPLEKILLETDCPFLSPVPHRGERNEPFFVKYVAEKIAEIKKIDVEEVEKITDKNAEKIFGLRKLH